MYSSTGTQWDLETTVCYYRHRMYEAELGSFVTRDPSEEDLNLHRYCENNPFIHTDPTGEGISSIDAAIRACMKLPTAAQRATCLENLLGVLKDSGYGRDLTKLAKCASSMRDLANHLDKLAQAQRQLHHLKELLRAAKAKKNQEALKKAIQELEKSIKGHIKEISQKWGQDVLKECCP